MENNRKSKRSHSRIEIVSLHETCSQILIIRIRRLVNYLKYSIYISIGIISANCVFGINLKMENFPYTSVGRKLKNFNSMIAVAVKDIGKITSFAKKRRSFKAKVKEWLVDEFSNTGQHNELMECRDKEGLSVYPVEFTKKSK